MADLTLITHVYNAQQPVDRQLALWQQFSPALQARLKFLVIDDHSDVPLQVDKGALDLRLVRVDDDIDWNMPGCRNLAATLAQTEWMLFFDVDNVASEASLLKIVDNLPRLDANRLHVFRRTENGVDVEPHINSFLITRQGFFKAGGYDEDFSGHYGYEDVAFRMMWRKHVGTEVLLTDIAFEQIAFRTSGLDRDLQRNQALIQQRAASGMPKPRGMLRFAWGEVAV
ncbi:MAG: hypothetical protein V4795_18675 [Pseudomonadota bacterium]